MNKLLSGGLAVLAGMVSLPAPGSLRAEKAPIADHREDPRYVRLMKFFSKFECPVRFYVGEFLEAADKNKLDWRLLPSLSFVESGGGKAAPHNNLFGWQSGKARFASLAASIQTVGYQLAHAPAYRKKNLDRLLDTYNPTGTYARRVKAVMAQIAPAQSVP
jgi:hypothetical protein